MKITDMIISAIIKKGILYEARNCDVEFDIPQKQDGDSKEAKEKIKVHFKAEHMTLRLEKGEES